MSYMTYVSMGATAAYTKIKTAADDAERAANAIPNDLWFSNQQEIAESSFFRIIDGNIYIGDLSMSSLLTSLVILATLCFAALKAYYDYKDYKDRKADRKAIKEGKKNGQSSASEEASKEVTS